MFKCHLPTSKRYCIAVDGKSSEQFKADMDLLADCFPNIFVFQVGKVEWCGYTIVKAVMTCLHYLSELNHKWKYVQYLSGVDLPLKTNLEMVRIFKRLNGTINASVLKFPAERLKSAANKSVPLPLWKSSLSSLLPRATVDAMIKSEKVRDLLSFLQLTVCPDESLWTTIAGNPADLPIINSFNATAIYGKLQAERLN
uniref:Uncharacterized protein n=1 Tax=Ditylenchus dipsaci TaxID=166011 RepID=A0A915DPU0_9BILA